MSSQVLTKSVYLSEAEEEELREISENENLPEEVLLKRWIVKGVREYRLNEAIRAYRDGMSLGQASEYARVTKRDLLDEIDRRGLSLVGSVELFDAGLKTIAEVLDDPEILEIAAEAM